jgi:sugar phosphate permease
LTGAVLAGFLSDKLKRRGVVVAGMLLCAVPLLILMRMASTDNFLLYLCIVLLVGTCTGGVANILSTACSADLASSIERTYHRKAQSTIAGIIDGIGGLGAGLGQATIGLIAESSWNAVFGFLIGKLYAGICLTAVLLLLPIIFKENREAQRVHDNPLLQFPSPNAHKTPPTPLQPTNQAEL